MASEIKVDTISEKTSANGVTIDGVNIKDSALATAGSVPLTTIDIDGGTDIGAAVVDADLFIIDDGAGGTNRKVTASRLKTYAGTTINNATANEIVTIASTTTELDAEANLTFDGTDVLVGGAGKVQLRDTGLYVASNADGDLDIVSDGTAVDSINLESAGGITLDAGTAGSGVIFEDDGTEMLRIYNSSSHVVIESKVQDKDIIFKGNDGGSTITPLTIDMSAAGALVLGAGGITFPASTSQSTSSTSDLNNLNDYERGTWTVSAEQESDGGFPDGCTQDARAGLYVKIGNLIYAHFYNALNDTGTLLNSPLRFAGLPFAVGSLGIAGGGNGIQAYNWVTAAPDNAIAIVNTDYMNLHERVTSGSIHNATNSKCLHIKADTSYCYGMIMYHDME